MAICLCWHALPPKYRTWTKISSIPIILHPNGLKILHHLYLNNSNSLVICIIALTQYDSKHWLTRNLCLQPLNPTLPPTAMTYVTQTLSSPFSEWRYTDFNILWPNPMIFTILWVSLQDHVQPLFGLRPFESTLPRAGENVAERGWPLCSLTPTFWQYSSATIYKEVITSRESHIFTKIRLMITQVSIN